VKEQEVVEQQEGKEKQSSHYAQVEDDDETYKKGEKVEKNALEIRNLTKTYGGGSRNTSIRAVDGISFSVKPGEIFGLLGPNGAGKTTTIKMIVTLAKATSGVLEVFGVDVSKSPETVRGMIGYVPQSISVDTDLTAYENLLIFSKLSYVNKKERDERIHAALQYMNLEGRANDLVKHFSGGMMRRLEIAQALVNRPRILLLDEPSIGLDPASKRQVWKNIKRLRQDYGTTILITTHDMNEADILCDRLAIMAAGKIAVMGNPEELKRTVVGGDIVTVTLASNGDADDGMLNKDIRFPAGIKATVLSATDASTIISAPSNGDGLDGALGDGNDGDKDNDNTSTTSAVAAGSKRSVIHILVDDAGEAIPYITDSFRASDVKIESLSVSKPTLDDVFMKYAKRRLLSDNNDGKGGEKELLLSSGGANTTGARRDFVRHAK
jgi:ABC-2 type transport system ATP-binding protein